MANYFAEGVNAKYFIKTEATYDTVQAFAATDAAGLIDLKFEVEPFYHETKERVGTASSQGFVKGARRGKWTAATYLKANAAGTAPDTGEMFKAAYGTETVSGGVSVTYALNDNAPGSLQLCRHVGKGFYEVVTGAWVEQVEYEFKGNEEPTVTFTGGFATYGYLYGAEVNTTASAAATTVLYKAIHRGNIGVNARVKFGTDDNSGAGYLITAVDNTATPPTVTISPGLAVGTTAGDEIQPVTPSQTISGTIIGGVDASFTADATSVGLMGGKVTYKTGIHSRDKEITANRATGLFRGKRSIEGDLQFYFIDKESGPIAGRAWDGTTRALILRLGPNTAAQRLKLNFPKSFMHVIPIAVPEADEATFSSKFQALQNSASADEHTAVWD